MPASATTGTPFGNFNFISVVSVPGEKRGREIVFSFLCGLLSFA
jgi:hypothetical protein